MTNPQTNATTVRNMYDAFQKGDIDSILAQLHDDVEWGSKTVAAEVPWLTWRKGKKEVQGFFTAVASGLDLSVFRPETFVSEGDQVVVRLRIEGALRKTEKPVASDAVHFWTFRDGKVARYQQFDDTAATLAAWRG